MPNYLLAYHGDETLPETQAEIDELMSAWHKWFAELGDDVIDGGNPVSESYTLQPNGDIQSNGGPNPITGYGIIRASDLADAQAKAQGCPVLKEESGSIELAQIVEM